MRSWAIGAKHKQDVGEVGVYILYEGPWYAFVIEFLSDTLCDLIGKILRYRELWARLCIWWHNPVSQWCYSRYNHIHELEVSRDTLLKDHPDADCLFAYSEDLFSGNGKGVCDEQ